MLDDLGEPRSYKVLNRRRQQGEKEMGLDGTCEAER